MRESNQHLVGLALVAVAVLAALGMVGGLYQWEKSKRAPPEAAAESPSPTPSLASQPQASPSPTIATAATPPATSSPTTSSSSEPSYSRDVLPILKARCFVCHSSVTLGGLNLSSYQLTTSTGKHAPTVVPGSPDGSILYLVLKGPASGVPAMPPGGTLPPADIEIIGRWITQGATDN